jgi:hypothetical protein
MLIRLISLSPGAQQLQAWMKKQKKPDEVADSFDTGVVNSLAKYSMFPAYPTSFIVAADTTIEVSQLSVLHTHH